MTSQNDRQDDSAGPAAAAEPTLRQRAENQARAMGAEDLDALSSEEARRLLHELRVHQVELEMQNEELRRAQEALEASRARYFDLYDLAPVGYLTVGEEGLILEANLTAATILGVDRAGLIRQSLSSFILSEDQDIYYLHRRMLFETQEPRVCEMRMVRKDGSQFWARIEAVALGSEGQAVCRATMSDITERKQAEEVLRESEEHYRTLFETAPVIIYTLSTDGILTALNPVFEQVTGWSRDEWLGRPFAEMFYADDSAFAVQQFQRVLQGAGEGQYSEMRIQSKAGAVLTIEVVGVQQITDGQVVGIFGFARDITERKRVEEALAAERSLLRTLVDYLPDAVYVKDDACRKTLANPADLRNMGASSEADVLGKIDFDFFPHDLATAFYADDQSVIQSGRPVLNREEMITLPDGTRGWQLTSKVPVRDSAGQVVGLVGIGHDITERRQAEVALQEAEARYHALVEQIPAIIYTDSAEQAGQTLYISPQLKTTIGCAPEEWIADNDLWLKIMHPDDRERVSAEYIRAYESGEPLNAEYRVITPEEQIVWIRDEATLKRDPSGRPLFWQGILLDITERKRAEEEIQRAERRYRSLFEDAPVMYVITRNQEGGPVIDDCNELFLSKLGCSRDQVLERPLANFYTPQSRAELLPGGGYHRALEGRFLVEERQLVTRDGQVIDTLLHASPETDAAGRVCGTRAAYVDITRRKSAEEALRASEQRFRGLFDGVPAACWTFDSEGTILDCNRGCEELYGWSAEQAVGKTMYELMVKEENAARTRENIAAIFQGQAFEGLEFEDRRADGTTCHVLASEYPVRDARGQVVMGICAQLDITERKQAEEDIRRQAARLEALRQVSLELATELDLDALLRSIVERAIVLVGGRWGSFELYRPELGALVSTAMAGAGPDLPGTLLWRGEGLAGKIWESGEPLVVDDYQHWEGRAAAYEGLPIRAMAGVPVRWGDEFLGVLNIEGETAGAFTPADAELLGLFAAQAAIAIHNARLYDEARRRNRELTLLNRVIAASAARQAIEPILETVCRELAIYFDAPQAAAALFDEEKTQAVVVAEYPAEGRPSALGESIPVAGNPWVEHLLTHKVPLAVGEAQTDPRLAAVHDLMRRWGTVSLLLVPLLVEGQVVGSLGVAAIEPRAFSSDEMDLVRRVVEQVSGALARARLQSEQQRLSTAVEQAAESVVITDTQGTILYVNPAFERISGYSREEVLGRNPRLLKSGKHDAAFYRDLWQTISAGQVWRGRLVNRHKGGSLYTLDTIITPVRNPAGEIVNYVATRRDVTRELQLEEQFHQAQKMEAVGRLAGGVAHDFNNLLTVIHLSTRLLERELHPQDPLRAHVQRIQEAGQRAANLTKQLLAFSRREIAEPQMLNLNQVLGGLNEMLQRLIGEDMELTLRPAKDLWPVRIDPTQAEQVVINLAVNARDAMPGGGKLTVETANVVLDEAYTARHLEVQPGEYVLLAVSDTGQGMSDEVKAHLFEPFFTTKELGKGTGLGLATVFGIVKQNQGHIGVYSELGQGTTFKIYLPLAGMPLAGMPSAGMPKAGMPRAGIPRLSEVADGQPASLHPPAQGTETLLLVEDEPQVRELTHDILLDHGYRVLTAGDGVEALRVAQAHEGPIHLLLTDVIMPRMSGKELADRLRTSRPEVRVLFTSGYTDNAIAHHGVLDEGVAFLSKPFEVEALARKVRSVLDGSD
jgi:PAS domain S-box-containing protein